MVLPAGVNSLLPLIEKCDNFEIPRGPWTAGDCLTRWTAHQNSGLTRTKLTHRPPDPSTRSAMSRPETQTAKKEDDFIVPFFVEMPEEDWDKFSKNLQPIGFLRRSVMAKLMEDNLNRIADHQVLIFDFLRAGNAGCTEVVTLINADDQQKSPDLYFAVAFSDEINLLGPTARSRQLERIVRGWKDEGSFSDILGGWRNELYTIYGPASTIALELERAACSLFGFATFGVHLNGSLDSFHILRYSDTNPLLDSLRSRRRRT
jgi:hypothetical protein